MALAILPGTFDPFTLGHLDIARRATRLFDQVEIAVAASSDRRSAAPAKARAAMARAATADLSGITVAIFSGLITEYALGRGALVLIRGLRSVSDFEYESRMAHANRRLASGLETVFLHTDAEHSFISASLVRDILRNGGDIRPFVPAPVAEALMQQDSGPHYY